MCDLETNKNEQEYIINVHSNSVMLNFPFWPPSPILSDSEGILLIIDCKVTQIYQF